MQASVVQIHNPIFYDLGGTFVQSMHCVETVNAALTKAFPEWKVKEQEYAFSAYNFSYLALHLPQLKYHAQQQTLDINGVKVDVSLDIVVRMSGNICFEYCYQIHQSQGFESILEILQGFINLAYTGYLKRNGEYKNAMNCIAQLDDSLDIPAIFRHCRLLDMVKSVLEKVTDFTLNSYCYPYQHGRLLFACDLDNQPIKDALLTQDFVEQATMLEEQRIYLGTWKTVLMVDAAKQRPFLNLYTDALSRFFQCQAWIFQCEHRLNEINQKMEEGDQGYKLLNQRAKQIESFYFTCNREMINFNNLSLPYKDEDYRCLAQAINDAIKLEGHIAQTYKHLNAVKEHINLAKLHIDSRTEKHAKFLKLLMALNLSAGIASLIPASLDGDIDKFYSSMLPPIVWITFTVIALMVLLVEFRRKA